MSSWFDQARERLERECKEVKGTKESAMKAAVRDTLLEFCRQDEEFAQAVAQGGSFPDCMKAVAKGVGNSISDLEAYRRAVQFYFPGAEVRFQMRLDLCPGDDAQGAPEIAPPKPSGGMLLDLTDFL